MLENNKRTRLLVIDPIGVKGHKRFNNFFLEALNEMGQVTFVSPENYLETSKVDRRINIPSNPLQKLTHKGRLLSHLAGFFNIRFVTKHIKKHSYDAIFFLAYETLPFVLFGPRGRKVFLFEHNNIERAGMGFSRNFLYKNMQKNIERIVLQQHIVDLAIKLHPSKCHYLPMPCDACDIERQTAIQESQIFTHKTNSRIVIFSPSRSTPDDTQQALKEFAIRHKNRYFVVCKGRDNKATSTWNEKSFFSEEEYVQHMQDSDFVFSGRYYNGRISAVVYEALFIGKPVILLDCPFARELQEKVPALVFIIDDMNDICNIALDSKNMKNQTRAFRKSHNHQNVVTKLKSLIMNQC